METILLIEDHPGIRENTAEILELAGYQVLLAANGKEGLALAIEKNPHLIICDIMMPGVNGYEVIQELKKNAGTMRIPFIFLTASTEPGEMKIGLDLGADGYLRKPFEDDELMFTIKQCLDKVEKAF